MAILEQKTIISDSGFKKEIDEAGLSMVLDNLQVNQYQYPVKSTIREIVSNGVDAMSEKNIAIQILTGKAKEEDYYIRRDDPLYKDSNFNAAYYDLKWLDRNNNKVQIIYEEGDQVKTRDRIRIIDQGVGLGGKRLEGYFKLSWSSKRNSRAKLGKFGIGAKAPLSTGVDSYRMITRYNGKKFTFDIYSHKVDSAVPKFDLSGSSMKANPSVTFDNGYTAYYEETTEKNGTEIIIDTKKHHRQQYIQAVREQLLYFKNVEFFVINESGYKQQVNFLASVLYEDKDIIISDNNQFSKPHLILGKDEALVNYGYIDFLELELNDVNGNIGIKVESEDVAINPSRESVIWNEQTRKTVVDKFNKVVEVASDLITKELKETNYIDWLKKASAVISGYSSSNNTILNRLSRIVDRSQISPLFEGDKSIKFSTQVAEMFPGYELRSVQSSYNHQKKVKEILRPDVLSARDINWDHLYITDGSAHRNKDLFILQSKGIGQFTLLTKRDVEKIPGDDKIFKGKMTRVELAKQQARLEELLEKSRRVISYNDIEIPDKWKDDIEKQLVSESAPAVQLSPEEKRKLEQRITLSALQLNSYRKDGKVFDRAQYEPKIVDIPHWEGTIVYGFQEDEELLHMVATMTSMSNNEACNAVTRKFTDSMLVEVPNSVSILLVAKDKAKLFKQFIHVKDYILTKGKDSISMGKELIRWNTARIIGKHLPRLTFLSNFDRFDEELTKLHKELENYASMYKVDPKDAIISQGFQNTKVKAFGNKPEAWQELADFGDKMVELQILIDKHPDDAEAIAAKSKELFGVDGIKSAWGVDLDMYKKLLIVLEYAESVGVLFNYISVLTIPGTPITQELETEIKAVIELKRGDSTLVMSTSAAQLVDA